MPAHGGPPSATGEHRPLTWATVARVVVDVMPKPEILDPQGQAIAGALARLGFRGIGAVRQGKHFELEVDDTVDSRDGVEGNDSLDGGSQVNGDTALTAATEMSIVDFP